MRFLVAPLLLLWNAIGSPGLAQDHEAQGWLALGANVQVGERVAVGAEVNQRVGSEEGGLLESQYLAAIGVGVAPGVTLTGGVNRVVAVAGGRVANTEWRPRQQIAFPLARIGPGALEGRLRLEQRFRSDGDDVGHRVRPRIGYTLPLSGAVALELGHESYFNLNTTDFGQRSGHERMRHSAALGFPLTQNVAASIGYVNQYRFNADARDLMEHALTSGLVVSFR